MNNPVITVLMSAYNAELFVANAVESVLNQTYVDFELLIFEDKSTDSTLEILRSFTDPRIRLISNTENRGLTKNLIHGMCMARGEFVARMDADDICMPHRLATQVTYMHEHPEVGVLGSAVIFFDVKGKEFVAYQPLEHEEIKCALFYGFTMLHPSVMIRKADFDKHGLNYDPEFRVSQDHDLWVRAIRNVRFANFHQPLIKMREHKGKIGNTQKAYQQELSNTIRRRQLKQLQVNFTGHELETFCADESAAAKWDKVDLVSYESILRKIFERNEEVSNFDQNMLVSIGVSSFRGKCRLLLLEGSGVGRYYWQSKLKCLDNPSMKQRIGMFVRSLAPRLSVVIPGKRAVPK